MEAPTPSLKVYTRREVWKGADGTDDYIVVHTNWFGQVGSAIENIHSVLIESTNKAFPYTCEVKKVNFRLDQQNSQAFYTYLLDHAERIK
jgi:predicted trehalose synthase